MHHQHASEGLVIISVNLDDFKDEAMRERAAKVLALEKAPFVTLAGASKEDTNAIVEQMKVELLPRNVFYDREGKEARVLEGADVEQLNRIVNDLLSKK